MTSDRTLFVPGRLEIFGKHTDYAGGRSLVAAVPRGITMSASPAGDGRVVIRDLHTGAQAEIPAHGDGPSSGWWRYPHTVVRRLAANFPAADLSATLAFSSDLPQAAGISSSSALIVAIAESLIACARLEDTAEWRDAIRTTEDRASYFGCIENGATYGPFEGSTGVGTHGGSEDHAAIVMSRAGELRQFSYMPLQLVRHVPMPAGWTFAVVSSGVAAEKSGRAQSDYNRLSQAAQAIVAAWREKHPGDSRSLGELASAGDVQRLPLPPGLRTRLDHFIAEDARVAEATEAFARGDIPAVGELADAAQSDADRLLRNQVPETRALVSLASATGAAAASAFGAGWGGSVWALVKEADAEPFLGEWLSAYRRAFANRASEGFVSPASAGAHWI